MTSDGSIDVCNMVTERLLTPMTIFYEAKKLNTKLQVLKVWYFSWSIPVKFTFYLPMKSPNKMCKFIKVDAMDHFTFSSCQKVHGLFIVLLGIMFC